MISGLTITVAGLPEEVHWLADALDTAFPNRIDWSDCNRNEHNAVVLVGRTARTIDTTTLHSLIAAANWEDATLD